MQDAATYLVALANSPVLESDRRAEPRKRVIPHEPRHNGHRDSRVLAVACPKSRPRRFWGVNYGGEIVQKKCRNHEHAEQDLSGPGRQAKHCSDQFDSNIQRQWLTNYHKQRRRPLQNLQRVLSDVEDIRVLFSTSSVEDRALTSQSGPCNSFQL